MQPLLDVQLTAGYGSKTTLHEVGFHLEAGSRTGVVGTSGAGKSTLVLALMGIMPWRQGWARGHVLLRGKDLLRCSAKELRTVLGNEVALVPQSPLTALNPALSLRSHFEELWRAHAAKGSDLVPRMTSLMERVELPTDAAFLKRKPAEISIGQAQRVMIALALLHRPSILVADEPTSALDVCTQQEIVHLLRSISEAESMALLYVSHDLITVFALCERMLVMKEGTLVDDVCLSSMQPDILHPATRKLLDTLPVDPGLLKSQAMGKLPLQSPVHVPSSSLLLA